jgi:glycosyltransferase involved in cell wall biosynthesis
MKPSISIVIASYNHASYIKDCVDSALAQRPAALEVIVVDDGSTDGSLQILRSYGSRIRLLVQPRARQAKARNVGVAVARGDWVAFLDSDDRCRPGRIGAAAQAIHDQPELTLVWSDYGLIDAAGALLREQRLSVARTDFARVLIAGNPICNSSVTVRRSVLLELGGFDESIPRACDGAAWYQLAARGHRFVHLPKVLVDYRQHGRNDGQHFALMTRERDLALRAGAAAYLQYGVVKSGVDLRWLRDAMARQIAFRAAAYVQKHLSRGVVGRLRASTYKALGSNKGLLALAKVKAAKDLFKR